MRGGKVVDLVQALQDSLDTAKAAQEERKRTKCGFCEFGIFNRGGTAIKCPYCDGTGQAP